MDVNVAGNLANRFRLYGPVRVILPAEFLVSWDPVGRILSQGW